MKVLIAAEIFPPDIGGPATYSVKIAEGLQKTGHTVKLVCYSSSQTVDDYSFSVFRIKRGQNKIFQYFHYFFSLFRLAKDVSVIYAQGPVASGLPAMVVGWLRHKPVVVKVVGDYAWEQASNVGVYTDSIDSFQTKKFFGKIGLLQRIEKTVCRRASKVITPSKYLASIVRGWGVAEEKIAVVYNAVEVILDEHIEVVRDPNMIISVGRLVKWKGFEALIKVMPRLLATNPKFHLLIAGGGPDHDRLETLIAKLNLTDAVSIKKFNHEALFEQLQLAGLFVLNTGYEGLPHTVLEALAVGVPVITTRIGGNPEVITNGENGLLVEYDNEEALFTAITQLHQNPEQQAAFVNRGKETAKQWNVETMLANTINQLESVCAS